METAAGGGGSDDGGIGQVIHRQDVALTLVKSIGDQVCVVVRNREEVLQAIAARLVVENFMRDKVSVDALDEGGFLAAQFGGMSVRRFELDEFARERGDHIPGALAGLARWNVAKIDCQVRGQNGRVADSGAKQLRNQQEVLLVLDDLGLLRVNLNAFSQAITGILDQNADGEGNRAFHLRGERIVALNIARLKIRNLKLRFGLDVNLRGKGLQNLRRKVHTRELSRQPTADLVSDAIRSNATRRRFGDNKPVDDCCGRRADHAVAADGINALKRWRLHEEQGRGVINRAVGRKQRILKRQRGREVGDRVRAVVVGDFQPGIKADALQR